VVKCTGTYEGCLDKGVQVIRTPVIVNEWADLVLMVGLKV